MMKFPIFVLSLIVTTVGGADVKQLASYYMSCMVEKKESVSVGAKFLFEGSIPDWEFNSEWVTTESRKLRCGFRRGSWSLNEFSTLVHEYENCWKCISNELLQCESAPHSHDKGNYKVVISRLAGDSFCSIETNCAVKTFAAARACLNGLADSNGTGDRHGVGCVMYEQTISNTEIPLNVPYVDAYYTRLLYWGRLIRCCGVLEDFGALGPKLYGLTAPRGTLHSEDHLAHCMKSPRIWLFLNDNERMKCGKLVGKNVVVEGRLSLLGDESNVLHELESLSVNLTECRILLDDSLCDTLTNNDPVCEYTSPCREFKIKVSMPDDKAYHAHCYSSTLWMARIEKGRKVSALFPLSLYAVSLKDVQRQVWESLKRIEAVLAKKCGGACALKGMCKARSYSQITYMNFTTEDNPEIASILADLFDLLVQTRNL